MNQKNRQFSLFEGIIAGLLFGTAAVFIRLSAEMSALSISLWRVIIASLSIATLILVFNRTASIKLALKYFKDYLVLGVLLGIHFILFVSAVKNTSILNATVLVNTTPIFSIIISSFLYRIMPRKLAIIGVLLAFIGGSLIAYGETGNGSQTSLVGDIEATLAAVAEGFYLNYGRKKRNQLPLLQTMLFIYIAAAFTIAPTLLIGISSFETPMNLESFIPLLGLGILPTAIAHTLYFSSLLNLKSFETATLALLEPIGATILGISIFAEIPTPIFIVGAILMLLGIFTVAVKD